MLYNKKQEIVMEVNLTTDLTTADERKGTFKLKGNPLSGAAYVEVLAGGGGGGGGGTADSTAANQVLQLAQETAINNAIGTPVASPAANTLLARVKELLTGIVLAAGTNLIGKVGIDQTTPGTTNGVSVNKTGAFANIATATLSNVASSASSITIVAANANRLRLIIYNDSTSILRIKFGATASSTSFTYALDPKATYESPTFNLYTGVIDGIWDSANGSARVTEMV